MIKVNKVFDHTKFRCFEYESEQSSLIRLGDIVLKEGDDEDGEIEIGVVIQTFADNEFRTDMFGMSSLGEIRFPNKNEIKKYRPELIKELVVN